MPAPELDPVQVLVLAVVQGLTEFLPVSSSGHLVLAETWLDVSEPGLLLPILLHLGTLAAVCLVYRRDVGRLVLDVLERRWREPALLVLATLPAVAVGFLAKDALREAFGDARGAAWGLLGTAAMLSVGEGARRRSVSTGRAVREELRALDALLIGCAQALAILPGVSRSGSTIATGLLLGVRPDRAARFSFLMSIPAILGATVLELADLAGEGEPLPAPGVPLLGLAVAALVGWGALRWLLAFVSRGAFLWFAVYCALLGGAFLTFS